MDLISASMSSPFDRPEDRSVTGQTGRIAAGRLSPI
jgi:hypothetical protein